MAELLLELLSEEIPARMQAKAAADLQRLVCDGLKEAGLSWDKAEAFATPRRLTLVIDGLPTEQADSVEERKGPAVAAPEQAIAGFLKSAGLDSIDACEVRDVKGKPTYFLVTEKKGGPTSRILVKIIAEALPSLHWTKSMRWANTIFSWARPLHNVLAIFNGEVFDFDYGLGHRDEGGDSIVLRWNNKTVGHRFLSSGEITVTDFADYRQKLANAHVMLCASERRAQILADAETLAADAGLKLRADEGLLNEVAGLVEWPVTLMGKIDDTYMDLPAEVLATTLRYHQKFFTLEAADGTLAPNFIVVSNMVAPDGGAAIRAGNERVLRARLADARFFWDTDRKHSLGSRAPQLKDIVFHAKLGTLDEKVDRVEALAGELAGLMGADRDQARSAARLCKCDLVTGMVYEFPELQGVMGRYYALADGEALGVADAIAEHYSPLGPADACPTAPVSVCVAMADKIDTLVGFWTINEKPTGSKDPFALRRAALGVIRLILENDLRLSLRNIFGVAYDLRDDPIHKGTSRHRLVNDDGTLPPSGEKWSLQEHHVLVPKDEAVDGLIEFFADRLKVFLKEKGTRHDLVDAVFALEGEDDLVRLLARVDALGAFLGTDDGANLLTAYKRAANILAIEEKKDKASYTAKPDAKLLEQGEEKDLAAALEAAGKATAPLLEEEDFAAVMSELAKLRAPVDAFFDHVTVNTEDAGLRQNRLKLLSEIRTTMEAVADFSKVEG